MGQKNLKSTKSLGLPLCGIGIDLSGKLHRILPLSREPHSPLSKTGVRGITPAPKKSLEIKIKFGAF